MSISSKSNLYKRVKLFQAKPSIKVLSSAPLLHEPKNQAQTYLYY